MLFEIATECKFPPPAPAVDGFELRVLFREVLPGYVSDVVVSIMRDCLQQRFLMRPTANELAARLAGL